MTKGIDISQWQGEVDFRKVKSQVDFVILREGYRQTIDPRFLEYVRGCQANGIPIKGVYHFCYSTNSNMARDEAKSCLANVQKAGLGKDTIIFFDFEYDTVTKAKEAGITLGKSECILFTKTFCNYIKSQGYRAGVYSNVDYYRNMYDKATIDQYIFWLADYTGEADLPCVYHQYTSGGTVAGISGKVDMDYCYEEGGTGMVRVSNCGHDERGKYTGGQAGDQTGTEWQLREWYAYPWNYVLRWKDPALGDLFADLAVEAANNGKIGYDQGQRDTFGTALKVAGWRPANVKAACETDCSKGTIDLIKAVGHLKGITDLQNCSATYTGDMMTWFRSAAGKKYFDVLTGTHLTDPSIARRGDINLNTAHHVNVTVDNGANADRGSSQTGPSGSAGKAETLIGQAQIHLNNFTGVGLDVDGEIGPKTKKAFRQAIQGAINVDSEKTVLEVDGEIGEKTKAALKKIVLRKGSRGNLVTVLEIGMLLHNINPGGVECPGEFGDGLLKALKTYQKQAGLTVDGEAGYNTFMALQK